MNFFQKQKTDKDGVNLQSKDGLESAVQKKVKSSRTKNVKDNSSKDGKEQQKLIQIKTIKFYAILAATIAIPIIIIIVLSIFTNIEAYKNPFALLIVIAAPTIYYFMTKEKQPMTDTWFFNKASKFFAVEKIYYIGDTICIAPSILIEDEKVSSFMGFLNALSNHIDYDISYNPALSGIETRKTSKDFPVTIKTSIKKELPGISLLDSASDNQWNKIPIGLSVAPKQDKVNVVNIVVNNEDGDAQIGERIIAIEDRKLSLNGISGSASIEYDILSHVSYNPDSMQCIIIDASTNNGSNNVFVNKRSGLINPTSHSMFRLNLKSPKSEEEEEKQNEMLSIMGVTAFVNGRGFLEQAFSTIRSFVIKRFETIRQANCGSIFDMKETSTTWYNIDGHDFQGDEIILCNINGQQELTTIEQAVVAVYDGMDVKIDI